jgi:MFS family permease
MSRRKPVDLLSLLNYLNPLALGRLAWLTGKRGWDGLWAAPGPQSRFFIATTFTWSVAMALTDPFKALYLKELGLSHLAIGGFFALDMSLRIVGVLLGGLAAQRWGHLRTLLVFDIISWTVACAVLALATEPWHVYVATCLTATNALVSAPVVQLLVEDTPQHRRTPMFALFNLTFVIPALLLPAVSGWMVEHWGVLPAMRGLFGFVALSTLGTTLWRGAVMQESKARTAKADLSGLLEDSLRTAQHLLRQPGFWAVLGIYLLSNMTNNLVKAWQSLYIVEVLGLKEVSIGQMASLNSLGFIIVSLAWVPSIRTERSGSLFFWSSLVGGLAAVGLAWATHPAVLLSLGLLGGLMGGLYGPILAGHLANLFPHEREGLAQALVASAMQAAVALSLALGGALFETRFHSYPYVLGLIALAISILAWTLKRREEAGA